MYAAIKEVFEESGVNVDFQQIYEIAGIMYLYYGDNTNADDKSRGITEQLKFFLHEIRSGSLKELQGLITKINDDAMYPEVVLKIATCCKALLRKWLEENNLHDVWQALTVVGSEHPEPIINPQGGHDAFIIKIIYDGCLKFFRPWFGLETLNKNSSNLVRTILADNIVGLATVIMATLEHVLIDKFSSTSNFGRSEFLAYFTAREERYGLLGEQGSNGFDTNILPKIPQWREKVQAELYPNPTDDDYNLPNDGSSKKRRRTGEGGSFIDDSSNPTSIFDISGNVSSTTDEFPNSSKFTETSTIESGMMSSLDNTTGSKPSDFDDKSRSVSNMTIDNNNKNNETNDLFDLLPGIRNIVGIGAENRQQTVLFSSGSSSSNSVNIDHVVPLMRRHIGLDAASAKKRLLRNNKLSYK